VKQTRTPVINKEILLDLVVPVLRSAGVVFRYGDGKIGSGRLSYQHLIELVEYLLMAAAAASGSSVSLSGVGVFTFRECGRHGRYKKYKAYVSDKIQRLFSDNQDLVSDKLLVNNSDELNKKFSEVLKALLSNNGCGDTSIINAGDIVRPDLFSMSQSDGLEIL
jgi:hypothetical protein